MLLAIVMVGLFLLRKRGDRGGADEPWPFYARRLLSSPEQVLYHRLVGALPELVVLAQVQVSRVLGVKKGFNFQQWNNRINRMSYDFVVCKRDLSVLAAIELDDASHDRSSRVEGDMKKNKATTDAGLRMIRWNVKSPPDNASIRAAFAHHLPGAVLTHDGTGQISQDQSPTAKQSS